MINIRAMLGLTYYISELDEFLIDYDKKHPKLSASQRKEIEKHTRVFSLRDQPEQSQAREEFWDKF